MALTYLQAAVALQKMDDDGTLTTLTLPDSATLVSGTRGRFALLGINAVFVNAGTTNFLIDPSDDTVYPMSLLPPIVAGVTAASSGAGALTGNYKVFYTNLIKRDDGSILSESPPSPVSNTITLSSKDLNVAGILTSDQSQVNARRIYRTAAGGNTFFHWVDLDGNTETVIEAGFSDASLSLIPFPLDLGNPPGTSTSGARMEIIKEWKGKLWGKAIGAGAAIDDLLFSGSNRSYAWNPSNALRIPPDGADDIGITALIPRRNVLGIAKRGILHQIDSPDPAVLTVRVVVPDVGCVSQESVVVTRDTARWLDEDGIYEWSDSGGVQNISKAQVHKWFTTDDDFNRGEFKNARAWFDPVLNTYNVQLASAGQTTLDLWINFDLDRRIWLGPHKTAEFTPTACGIIRDTNNIKIAVLASSNGFIWTLNGATRTDGASSAIDYDIIESPHSADTPDIMKQWLEPSVHTNIESSGTLDCIPNVGGLDASAGTTKSHDLTTGRERLSRVGSGEWFWFRFRNNVAGIPVNQRGYELPFFELGRR